LKFNNIIISHTSSLKKMLLQILLVIALDLY